MDEIDGQQGEEENEDDEEGFCGAMPKQNSDQRRTMASDGEEIGEAMESSGNVVIAALEVCSNFFAF